jgi:hypothetical protein
MRLSAQHRLACLRLALASLARLGADAGDSGDLRAGVRAAIRAGSGTTARAGRGRAGAAGGHHASADRPRGHA